jgi:hypothetical protein
MPRDMEDENLLADSVNTATEHLRVMLVRRAPAVLLEYARRVLRQRVDRLLAIRTPGEVELAGGAVPGVYGPEQGGGSDG